MLTRLKRSILLVIAAVLALAGCKQPDICIALVDADGDGWPARTDCDDDDPSRNPAAIETCDEIDNDCDGLVDEGPIVLYPDLDGDGFGTSRPHEGEVLLSACESIEGYARSWDDCDDLDAEVHPGAAETCDERDEDCDGEVDDGDNLLFRDSDGDGFGLATSYALTVCDDLDGFVGESGDCNDSDAAIHPDADEVCNGLDDNCDGSVDEGVELNFFPDGDGDAFGDASQPPVWDCTAPLGYASGGDCDDTDPAVYPGAVDPCGDAVDADCDGFADPCYLADADAMFVGTADGDQLYSSAFLDDWDVDLDEFDEVVIGALNYSGAASSAGGAFVWPSEEVVPGTTVVDECLAVGGAVLAADIADANFGRAIVTGDVTGDGIDDVVVAASEDSRYEAVSAGAFYVFEGPVDGGQTVVASDATAIILGEDATDHAGSWHGLALTDLDGDTHLDLLLGARCAGLGCQGAAYVVFGPLEDQDEFTLAEADARFLGEHPADGTGVQKLTGDSAGQAVAAGDVTGDLVPDFLIQAQYNDDGGVEAGKLYIVSGASIEPNDLPIDASLTESPGGGYVYATFVGDSPLDMAGYSVAAVDLDGDGDRDVVVGTPGSDWGGVDSGVVYVFQAPILPGQYPLSMADAIFYGEQAGDVAGESVAGAGDFDFDGYPDLVVGAPGNDDNGTDSGKVYLIRGGPPTDLWGTEASLAECSRSWVGEADLDFAGSGHLTGGGDVNGDDYADILVVAPYHDDNGADVGKVYLLTGGAI